jgi:hypothetical protein
LTIGKKQEIQKRYRAALKNKGFFSEIALKPILYKYTNVDREKIYIYVCVYVNIIYICVCVCVCAYDYAHKHP